jgi:hypothetical protein
VRLPGGGVRVRRSALTLWLHRLEGDTQDGPEQRADGQLRRQVLGHQKSLATAPQPATGSAAVDGREHCKSFKARPLADGFLTDLKDAVRDRRLISPRTGLSGAESADGR